MQNHEVIFLLEIQHLPSEETKTHSVVTKALLCRHGWPNISDECRQWINKWRMAEPHSVRCAQKHTGPWTPRQVQSCKTSRDIALNFILLLFVSEEWFINIFSFRLELRPAENEAASGLLNERYAELAVFFCKWREIFNNLYTTVCVEYGICQEICDIYVTDSVLKLH